MRLVVEYRRTYLNTLLNGRNNEAERVRGDYQQADERTQQEYEDTEVSMENKRRLSSDEESELKMLWRELVKLFHPDRYAGDPEKQETYTKLTGAINTAKDNGALETLRQIAEDPAGFVMRQGWTAIDFGDTDELEQLEKLLHSLEAEIIMVIEATDELKKGPNYELYEIVSRDPDAFEVLMEEFTEKIGKELVELRLEAERLQREIVELTGNDAPIIG